MDVLHQIVISQSTTATMAILVPVQDIPQDIRYFSRALLMVGKQG